MINSTKSCKRSREHNSHSDSGIHESSSGNEDDYSESGVVTSNVETKIPEDITSCNKSSSYLSRNSDRVDTEERRLEINRQRARDRRKRKKIMIEDMQRQLIILKNENNELRSQNHIQKAEILRLTAMNHGAHGQRESLLNSLLAGRDVLANTGSGTLSAQELATVGILDNFQESTLLGTTSTLTAISNAQGSPLPQNYLVDKNSLRQTLQEIAQNNILNFGSGNPRQAPLPGILPVGSRTAGRGNDNNISLSDRLQSFVNARNDNIRSQDLLSPLLGTQSDIQHQVSVARRLANVDNKIARLDSNNPK